MTAMTGLAIARFQLVVLKGAVKLESKGMKRRGRSATTIVRQMFNEPASTSRDVLIQKLEAAIQEFDDDQQGKQSVQA